MALRADAFVLLCFGAVTVAPGAAAAAERFDPFATLAPRSPIVIDVPAVLASGGAYVGAPVEQPDLSRLGKAAPPTAAQAPGQLPPGWVQIGEVVQRQEVADGTAQVAPEPLQAWEDIEGNQYPRRGTVFLNFNGGVLKYGEDNSAESKSILAKGGQTYPAFGSSEATALAIIQAVKDDMATFGVRVLYEKRPSKVVPYTMAMVGGSWTDTNLSDPAGGVAPGTDCEDRAQRNVVYAFDTSSATISQEVAHAWGLDHTMGSDRIMSYQQGSNKKFGDNCQELCEEACQGPGTIGCPLIHEKYCGVGSETQNDLAELKFIFGDAAPDMEPPSVEIVEPAGDSVQMPPGTNLHVEGKVHDNYGGVGWKLRVTKDGEVIYDQVDYDRVMAWNFQKLPVGTYQVVLEAEDHADHVVQDKLTILVTEGGGETAGGTGEEPTTGAGSESAGEETDGATGGGSGQAPDTSTETDGKQDDGGGCRISHAGGDWHGLLAPLGALAWAGWARRRRTRA